MTSKSEKKHSRKKNNDFFQKVLNIVAKIPSGKVATYGDIAEVCGIRSSARTVGWALNGAKDSGLPCHRVVNRFGALTGKIHFGDPNLMKELLLNEGITFDEHDCVVMEKHRWIPKASRKRSHKIDRS